MGKKNISVVEQSGVMACFRSGEKVLTIALRPEVISKIKDNMVGEDIPHDMIEDIEEADLEELFEITMSGVQIQ